jgi:hypothetical protein
MLDAGLHAELREGMRALPVPAVSPEFDERVLRALDASAAPWWRVGWVTVRPVLAAGACSLVGGLVLLRFAATVPAGGAAPVHRGALASSAAAASSVDADVLIELAARRRAALRAVLSSPPALPTSRAAPDRRSEALTMPLA